MPQLQPKHTVTTQTYSLLDAILDDEPVVTPQVAETKWVEVQLLDWYCVLLTCPMCGKCPCPHYDNGERWHATPGKVIRVQV